MAEEKRDNCGVPPNIYVKSIKDVVEWTKRESGGRLMLAAIQRSAVWRHSQIINYWDSLLRGYPAGLMLVHGRAKNNDEENITARTVAGDTRNVDENDLQLFDGQQRLTAILLGMGEGQLKGHLKLWVDLGHSLDENANLRFLIRVTSTGQPFGYKVDAPNEKQPIEKRRNAINKWKVDKNAGSFDSVEAFTQATGEYLIDATFAIPLADIIKSVAEKGAANAKRDLGEQMGCRSEEVKKRLDGFVDDLDRALKAPILFQEIDLNIVKKKEDYIRFFERLGQGGTQLSNNELTYSIIKHHFPHVPERMRDITTGSAGRLTDEVNLVLAALRVAKVTTSAPQNSRPDWHIYGRPNPQFAVELKGTKDFSAVIEAFDKMIPKDDSEKKGGDLQTLLESVRRQLEYHQDHNPSGLPAMLLARLPHELVDVLLLMASQEQKISPAFALYWLLFVADSGKAADAFFRWFCEKKEIPPNMGLVEDLEKREIARRLPSEESLKSLQDQIEKGNHLLRSWPERFKELDADPDRRSGDALRVLSTNRELIVRSLLWLQREYLAETFPKFDPTSSRDEDLPIDLDHLIPRKKFGEDWRKQKNQLLSGNDRASLSDSDMVNFKDARHTVGNSLGNYRWLGSSENRRRQNGQIENRKCDFIGVLKPWNDLIDNDHWGSDAVASFQRLIDLRTVSIYQEILNGAGLKEFVMGKGQPPLPNTP